MSMPARRGRRHGFLHGRVMQSRNLTLGAAAALASAAFVHQRAWLAERANPPIGRFIDVDGVRMHYLERGEGTCS